MSNPATSLPPGFRFHPTDEELIFHYLRNRAASLPCPVSIIAEVDIYKFDPWDLPPMAMFGDREWYFFTPRDRKYPNGIRPNRAAASGYWKATGTDKPISTSSNENIGVKKALVFYQGRPPKGLKTNWIMHEYRLAESLNISNSYKPIKLRDSSMRLDDWVLCRIYKKSNNPSPAAGLMDHEQEDSGSEEVNFYSMPTSNTTQTKYHNNNNSIISTAAAATATTATDVDLHKSSSLNDFLNLLFDNPSEVLGATDDQCNVPLIVTGNNQNNSSVQQQIPSYDCNESSFGKSSKMQRQEEYCSTEPDSKRLMIASSNTCNPVPYQIESSQYNILAQPFLNQQILLNSHFGLH